MPLQPGSRQSTGHVVIISTEENKHWKCLLWQVYVHVYFKNNNTFGKNLFLCVTKHIYKNVDFSFEYQRCYFVYGHYCMNTVINELIPNSSRTDTASYF